MPVEVDRDLSHAARQSLRIGLINNMPDSALRATERQFASLLNSAAEHVDVQLFFYSLPGIVRTESGRRYTDAEYLSAKDLPQSRLDAIILTGSVPSAADLREEPYWNALTEVLEWAEENTHSAICSCLAAHAEVLHSDGINRRHLSQKRFGVFECLRVAEDPITDGVSSSFPVPHSRWNDLDESQLIDCGYRILSRDRNGSVDAFLKRRKSLFLFFQGHPEYDADSLLREYRRDVASYRNHETSVCPAIPEGYFPESDPQLENVSTWRDAAARIYRNWIAYLCAQKAPGPRP